MSSVHDFTVKDIDGNEMALSQYQGTVLLLVNVASKCGLTPQYEGLQSLQGRYGDKGFTVIGFPCNQFADQEPGTEAEIKTFCSTQYRVTFPMAAKLEVNGPARHPLYEYLAGETAAFPGDITWNFEKFLVGKLGEVVHRFSPKVTPDSEELASSIDAVLDG